MVSVIAKTRTITNGTIPDATPVEQNYVDLYTNDATLATAVTTLQANSFSAANFPYLNLSASPVYTTSSVITVPYIYAVDNAQATIIAKGTSSTINTGAVGVGGVAQSANQTGTISVSSGGTAVTGTGTSFTTVLQAGDMITTAGGQIARISSVNSNTSLTIGNGTWSSSESGVTFKRGGTGAITWYYLYAITNGTTTGLLASTRNVALGDTLVDLPSGYNTYRQLRFAYRTDPTSLIIPFTVTQGADQPIIAYRDYDLVGSNYKFAASGTSTTLATLALTLIANPISAIPPVSKLANLYVNNTGAGGGTLYVAPGDVAGSPTSPYPVTLTVNAAACVGYVSTDSSQNIKYKVDGTAAFSGAVAGFVVTEIK